MKIILLVALFFINNAFSQNQEVIPSSPIASALGKYVDNPVSLYTGVPQITIPLYDLKVKDYTLPINLSYHPASIKVEETPSNIGLGWVLNAGGMISRVVKDIPDDYIAPNCPETYNGVGPEPDCRNGLLVHKKNISDIDIIGAYNEDASNPQFSAKNIFEKFFSITSDGLSHTSFEKLSDSEPDVFYYNFCGKSGKFVFDVISGIPTIKILSQDDLKITHVLSSDGRISKFEVVDDMGITYLFEDVDWTMSIVDSESPFAYPEKFGEATFSTYALGHSETGFNSSWNLTKITTSKGNEINFKYAEEMTSILNSGAQMTDYYALSATYNPNINIFHGYVLYHRTNYYAKRLTGIETQNTKIEFNSDYFRQDVFGVDAVKYPKIINGLTVYLKQLDILSRIKKITFNQDYFESPIVSTFLVGGYTYSYYPSDENSQANDLLRKNMNVYFKRLRLRSVTEFGTSDTSSKPSITCEYKYDGFPGSQTTDRLPHRFSQQQDLWGFYNGAAGNRTLIPTIYVYPDMYSDSRRFSVYRRLNYTGREYVLNGSNRLPAENLMDIGVLTKIIYQTKGYTKYEYEPHKFRDGSDEFIGGGLRIKKIIKHDGVNTAGDIIYNYSYLKADNTTSGEIISMPVFALCDGAGSRFPLDNSNNAYLANTSRFSQPQAPLGTTQGSNVGYRMVTESNTGNGRTVYEYSMPALWNDSNDRIFPQSQADCSLAENGDCNGLYAASNVHDLFPYSSLRSDGFNLNMNPATINSFPFPENPNYDWNRGQLLFKKQYNNSGSLVKEESYNYSIKYFGGLTAPGKVYGIKFGMYYPVGNEQNPGLYYTKSFRVAKYSYLTNVTKVLTSKNVTNYSENGSSMTSRIDYKYEGISHKNITKITTETSTADKQITVYKYAPDYGGVPGPQEGMYALRSKQISSVPVETTNYVLRDGVENLSGSTLSTYSLINNIAQPDRSFKLEAGLPLSDFQPSSIQGPGIFTKDSRYAEKLKYKRYDAYGNILEVEDKDSGLITSYIWGYNNQYPIAKVVNATYDNIIAGIASLTLANLNKGYQQVVANPGPPKIIYKDAVLTDSDIRSMLGTLRTSLPNAEVTIYTYKPLIGISSVTDPKGETTSYEYDSFGRLDIVKDKNGNILSENQYNYKQ